MSRREGLSWEEHCELCEAARERFRCGDIGETEFRRLLGNLGFNATDIDREVEENQPL